MKNLVFTAIVAAIMGAAAVPGAASAQESTMHHQMKRHHMHKQHMKHCFVKRVHVRQHGHWHWVKRRICH